MSTDDEGPSHVQGKSSSKAPSANPRPSDRLSSFEKDLLERGLVDQLANFKLHRVGDKPGFKRLKEEYEWKMSYLHDKQVLQRYIGTIDNPLDGVVYAAEEENCDRCGFLCVGDLRDIDQKEDAFSLHLLVEVITAPAILPSVTAEKVANTENKTARPTEMDIEQAYGGLYRRFFKYPSLMTSW